MPITVGMAAKLLPGSLEPGPDRPAIIIVGQNPGANEDKTGEPFVGRSGKMVREVFVPEFTQLGSIYLTNGVRCYTINNDLPPARCYKACRPWLLEDHLEILKVHSNAPVLYLCLGGPAAKTVAEMLLGETVGTLTKALKLNGREWAISETHQGAFFCTYHPAYIDRKNAYIHPAKDHVALAASWLKGFKPQDAEPNMIPPRPPRW